MSTPDPTLTQAAQNQHAPRLPRQVQAQVDRARSLEAQRTASAAATAAAETPAPGATPPTEAMPQDPPPAPAAPAADPSRISVGKLDLAELINLADYSAADPARESDPVYWKARFMVADGMAKKTRQVNETNRSLQAEVDRLNKEVTRLKTSGPASAAAPASSTAPIRPEDIDLSRYYTPEQIEEYGEAQLRAHLAATLTTSERIIQEHVEQRVSARLEPIEQERETARQRQEREALERSQQEENEYVEQLTELLPEWSEINKDPRWLRWLDGKNSDGISRQVVLDTLSAARDAERTAALFKAYLEDAGAKPKPPLPAPLPPATPPGVPGVPQSMADMPYPMTPHGYKQWKTALARTRGIWRGNVELTKQIEARYNAAIASGTLVNR